MRWVGQAQQLEHLQVHQQPKQVASLVRARHVAGLILDPDAAVRREPEPLAEGVRAEERRGDEPVAVDLGDRAVQAGDQRAVVVVADATGAGQVIGVEQAPVPELGIRRSVVAGGREGHRRDVQPAAQDVVGVVVRARVRALEWVRIVPRWRGAAPGADQRAGEAAARGGHRASSTPVRALNSPIMRSQSVTIVRMSVQNFWSLRTRKSSIGTSCCSTQVK